MNNSQVVFEQLKVDAEPEVSLAINHRIEELQKIVEALRAVNGSEYWKYLQEKVWNGILVILQNKIRNEKDEKEIYRLQGQITWAQKYLDLEGLSEAFKNELKLINSQINQINGKESN